MNKNRNPLLDIMKGISILLIVLGHSSFPMTHYVYLFHVAVFIILSGSFFKEEEIASKEQLKKYIIKKLKRLYIPYVIFNTVFVLLNNVFINWHIYDLNAGHSYYAIADFAKNIFKILLFKGNAEIMGGTWFLELLFFISILYASITYFLTTKKIKHKRYIHTFIALLFLLLGYYASINNINILMRKQILTCYILFDIGTYLKEFQGLKNKTYALILACILGVTLYLLNGIGEIEISKNIYTSPIFFVLCSIMGYFLVYLISTYCQRISLLNTVFSYVGVHTMSILILHFVAFKFATLLLILIKHESILLLGRFPVAFKGEYYFIIYSVFGMVLPLIIERFWTDIFKKKKVGYKNEK